jgi:hypothetical protein
VLTTVFDEKTLPAEQGMEALTANFENPGGSPKCPRLDNVTRPAMCRGASKWRGRGFYSSKEPARLWRWVGFIVPVSP